MTPRSLRFRLVNVFAEDSCWSGNALAVIEDARDLSDEEMQAIALQFNLSETNVRSAVGGGHGAGLT